jgi:hypothetical protein
LRNEFQQVSAWFLRSVKSSTKFDLSNFYGAWFNRSDESKLIVCGCLNKNGHTARNFHFESFFKVFIFDLSDLSSQAPIFFS